MSEIPLRLGPLQAEGLLVYVSHARWLCEPGQWCRANQPIAYFNIAVDLPNNRYAGASPFSTELNLQVVCAPRVTGRLRYDATAGGYLSIMSFLKWDPDRILCHLDVDEVATETMADAGRLLLLVLAGRRMTHLSDVHTGLLPGWHSHTRAWWGDGGERPITLISNGICDVTGIILGEQCAYLDLFEAETASTHVIHVPDQPISPAAPFLLDQLTRTEKQYEAMAADLQAALNKPGIEVTSNDWMFAGAILATQKQPAARENFPLLTPTGLIQSGPPDAVLLSLTAEAPVILQHKALGYRISILQHYLGGTGPALRNWLSSAFERIKRTADDIRADYEKLIDAYQALAGTRVLILNGMSTSGNETIASYSAFDAPLGASLGTIASKELNLMLHDLTAGRNVSIIDVDALATEVGAREHLPDGIHQSRYLQELLRAEILGVLKELRTKKPSTAS